MGIGMGEIVVILFSFGVILAIFGVVYFLAKFLNAPDGKTCPHCSERIQRAAKVCRYCQRDVAEVEIENKPPRGLFQ